jgi:mannose-1-phosphate guanylyltransferase
MQNALLTLKNQVASFKTGSLITDEQLQQFAANTVVVLMAGGESSRFKQITGDNGPNKNSFKLPNDDTMIEMAIRLYRDAGFKDFVCLVYHAAESVVDLLGDGSKYGVRIQYSYDPGKPVGKGGAVKHALEEGVLPNDKNYIIQNPDDVIINNREIFVKQIVSGHLSGVEEGAVCSVVVVEGTPYPFTGMKVTEGFIDQIDMYPTIPIPTHIGVTIFSPQVNEYFMKMFDYSKKSDFEKELFPVLSAEKKLWAVNIDNSSWLAVNNPKAYKELLKVLGISTS